MNTMSKLLFAILTSVLVAGCSGNGKPVTLPVKVTISYKGQPAPGALVVLHPVNEAREKEIGGKPFGTVKDDGTLSITTYEDGDGAPEGEYGVTVQWNEAPKAGKISLTSEGGGGRDKFSGRYGDPRNPKFKFTVKSGSPNELDLKLD